jgi:hypothetical protein
MTSLFQSVTLSLDYQCFFCFFPEYLVCHTCMELHDDISPSIIQFHLTFTLTEKPLRILGEIQSV